MLLLKKKKKKKFTKINIYKELKRKKVFIYVFIYLKNSINTRKTKIPKDEFLENICNEINSCQQFKRNNTFYSNLSRTRSSKV